MADAPPAKPAWDSEMRDMIRRFGELGPAREGFVLTESETIVNPVLYHRSLELEIRHGPGQQRALSGSLKRQLAQYLDVRSKLKK